LGPGASGDIIGRAGGATGISRAGSGAARRPREGNAIVIYRLLADAVLLLHFGFILFVIFGGFLCFRWPKLVWAHIPAALWGGVIALVGWICPLTFIENHFRVKGAGEGYSSSFIDQYLLPVIYPERLIGDFPAWGFVAIGFFILAFNGLVYRRLWERRKALASRDDSD